MDCLCAVGQNGSVQNEVLSVATPKIPNAKKEEDVISLVILSKPRGKKKKENISIEK